MSTISTYMLNSYIDKIVGLYNTTASQSTGGFDGKFLYVSEWPVKAMDTLLTTKYVNFGSGCSNCVVHQPGVGTGFFVTPLISNATLAIGIHFGTADDYPNRDPITVTVEGSNETTNEKLHQGSSWTLLYSGPTGINLAVPPRSFSTRA